MQGRRSDCTNIKNTSDTTNQCNLKGIFLSILKYLAAASRNCIMFFFLVSVLFTEIFESLLIKLDSFLDSFIRLYAYIIIFNLCFHHFDVLVDCIYADPEARMCMANQMFVRIIPRLTVVFIYLFIYLSLLKGEKCYIIYNRYMALMFV